MSGIHLRREAICDLATRQADLRPGTDLMYRPIDYPMPEAPQPTPAHKWDFFVSRAGGDSLWAEWIAWQLEAKGHTLVIQDWDFGPGVNFVHMMQKAATEAESTIAVLSPR